MKKFILLAMSVTPAFSAEHLAIDHATVCGMNVASLRSTLEKVLAAKSEYGGPHSNHATEMDLMSFPDGSYLELMGIQPNADPVAVSMHEWSPFLKDNAGPCAFALRVSDINAEIAQLRGAGIKTGTPEPSGRARPDGVKIAWETVSVGPGHRGSLFPFLIRDTTPRENRVNPSGKPTTDRFDGIAKVIVGVRNLDSAIAQYEKAFRLPAPRRKKDAEFAAEIAWFENTPIVLAQGIGETSWLTRRVAKYGDAPSAFILRHRGEMPGTRSEWFGTPVIWIGQPSLGWRLGVEAVAAAR